MSVKEVYGERWAWGVIQDDFWHDSSMRIGPVARGHELTGRQQQALAVLRDLGWDYDCMEWMVDRGERPRARAESPLDAVLNV